MVKTSCRSLKVAVKSILIEFINLIRFSGIFSTVSADIKSLNAYIGVCYSKFII